MHDPRGSRHTKPVPLRVFHFLLRSPYQARRLLASFQNNLEEITIIATPDDDVAGGPPSRAVQLHSFVDPCKGAAKVVNYTVTPSTACLSMWHALKQANSLALCAA